jgi:hypothetical protein
MCQPGNPRETRRAYPCPEMCDPRATLPADQPRASRFHFA